MATKAFSYTRFSTPEQASGDSARRQIELAELYAAAHGLELDESLRLRDEGVSGFRGANVRKGALGQFLQAVDDGDVPEGAYLLVESLDRVSRQNPWDALPIFQQIINAGVVIVTLFDNRKYDLADMRANPFKIMESLFVMVRANEESEIKSRRLRSSWAAKRSNAAERLLTSIVPAWLKREGDQIVTIPDRVEVVRRVVTMTLQGVGQHRIAQTLNKERVPVFRDGTMWHRSYIKKLIENAALVGRLVPHEVVHEGGRKTRRPLAPVEGYYPAVVSEDEWSDLKAVVGGGRRAPQDRSAGVQNVLAGLASCGICGSTMTRVMKGNGRKGGRPKLICTRAKAGAGCEYHTADLPSVEQTVRTGVWEVVESAPSGDDAVDAELAEIYSKLEGIDTAISVLLDEMIEQGRSAALSNALAELETEKRTAEAALREAGAKHTAASGPSLVKRQGELLDAVDGPVSALNVRLRAVFDKVIVDQAMGQLRFVWLNGIECNTSLMYRWVDK